MIKLSPTLAIALLSVSLVLQGCSSVRKNLGIDREAPNEYDVTPCAQPLEMPPDFSCLPSPVPGAERPQDRAARQAQDEKFLGATHKDGSVSPGQKALLDMSKARTGQDAVRSQVNKEARMERKKEKTIVERLGITKQKPRGDAIDPYAEAEELKQRGVTAPCPAGRR